MATLTTEFQLLKQVYVGNTGYGNVYARLYAKYNSQDITNNKSNVTVQLRVYTEGAYWFQQNGGYWAVGLSDNPIVSGQANQQFNVGETTIGTTTGDVSHNDDGTKECACLGSINFTEWGFVANCDTSATLPTIQRASTLSSVTNSISTNGQIVKVKPTFTKNVSSYYQILKLYSADRTINIATFNGVANNIEYSFDSTQINTLYNYIGTRTSSVSVTCDLETYVSNGGTYIGKTSVLTYFQLPEYTVTASFTNITDTITAYNTYKGSGNENKIYIVGLSKPQFEFSASSSTGSYYGMSVTFKLNNTVRTSPYIENNYTGQSFVLNATDGRKTSSDVSPTAQQMTVIQYFKPTLNATVTRLSPTSDKINVSISGSYYDGNGLTNLETPTAILTYTEQGGTQQQESLTLSTTTSGHTVNFTANTQLTGMNYQKKVTWNVIFTDLIGITANKGNTLPQGLPVWNGYRKNDKNYFHINGNFSADEIDNLPVGGITARVNTNGFNANNLTTSGFYQVATSLQTYSNLPTGFNYGILIVLAQTGGNNGAFQTLQLAFGNGGYLWFRSRVNDGWQGWVNVTTTAI